MLTPRKRKLRSLGIWLGEIFSPVGGALVRFVKGHVVMVVALLAALVTMLFVPVDKAYVDYFDVKTLACLFCVLAICVMRGKKPRKSKRICWKLGSALTLRSCPIAWIICTRVAEFLAW